MSYTSQICGSLQISSVISQWTSLAVSVDIFGSLWHLRQSLDIFGSVRTSSAAFRHLRLLSDIFGSFRISSSLFGSLEIIPNCWKNDQKKPLWYNKHRRNIDISYFRAWFVCLWEKKNRYNEFFNVSVKMAKN